MLAACLVGTGTYVTTVICVRLLGDYKLLLRLEGSAEGNMYLCMSEKGQV